MQNQQCLMQLTLQAWKTWDSYSLKMETPVMVATINQVQRQVTWGCWWDTQHQQLTTSGENSMTNTWDRCLVDGVLFHMFLVHQLVHKMKHLDSAGQPFCSFFLIILVTCFFFFSVIMKCMRNLWEFICKLEVLDLNS